MLLLLSAHQLSLAGQERGNGGDAVVCYQPGFKDSIVRDTSKITSIELLDIYEGRVLKGMQFETTLETDYIKIAKKNVDKLAKLSPRRHAIYTKGLQTFLNEMVSPSGIQLTDVDDSKHIAIPLNCKIEQLVIQKNPEFPGDKRYTIDGDLWALMNAEQQAATVTHELIYSEMLNANDSRGVRHLNSLLNSKNFLNMTAGLWLVHQHWSRTSYIEFENLVFQDLNTHPELNNDYSFSYKTISNEYLKKAGLQEQGFESAFNGLLKGMSQAEIAGVCSFNDCKISSIRGFQNNGLPISEFNYFHDLNAAEELNLYFIEFNSSLKPIIAKIGTDDGQPFEVELSGLNVKSLGHKFLITKVSNGNWIPGFFTLVYILNNETIEFTGHPGTKNIKLGEGQLLVTYTDGSSKKFLLQTDIVIRDGVFGFNDSGYLSWAYLRGVQEHFIHSVLFNDNIERNVCGSERLDFDNEAKPIFNKNWRSLKTSMGNCYGTVKINN